MSDIDLTCQVVERIQDDPGLAGEFITVEVQNRVVNLLGTVSSLYARIAAADLARSTPGIADICNRLVLTTGGDRGSRQHPAPEPFDDIVAGWHTHQPQPRPTKTARPRPPTGPVRAAAGLLAAATGILWLAQVPLRPGAGLLVVVCLTGAATLVVLAGQASS
ncbi:BON domain-containing protein [Actinoplanes philippinensis]|uniref:BON domain-containing protein n=1 Tax=Actinoplanes philippinensis TaxID=35752 RepID=UPI0033FDB251